MKSTVRRIFRGVFNVDPQWIVRAPGRVNLIGDHTDYNDGYVLPMAIERGVWIALRARADRNVVVHSYDFNDVLTLDLNELKADHPNWREYVKAVAWSLDSAGLPLMGWEGVVLGDVPIGSGLSSSAAFEVAVARTFAAVGGWEWQPRPAAQLMQKAENDWVGVASGIMDPLISAIAQSGSASLIDCRDLKTTHVPIPAAAAVIIMNTMKRRGLVGSAYNERRQQCEEAAAFFGLKSLRNLSVPALKAAEGKLDPLAYRRARHVLTENERVLQVVDAFRREDGAAAGELMNASHASLRDDFEVSCHELDQMVSAAQSHPACYGARMTGAGFGGCAVALVQQNAIADFIAKVSTAYSHATGVDPQLLVSHPAAGAEAIPA
jgi:galactokinase